MLRRVMADFVPLFAWIDENAHAACCLLAAPEFHCSFVTRAQQGRRIIRYLIIIFVLLVTSTATAQTGSSIYVLSDSETSISYGGFQYAMENSQDHQVVDWLTPATGLNGTTVAIKTYRSASGQYCREYLATIQFGAAVQQYYGTACRQSDASWKVAEERIS